MAKLITVRRSKEAETWLRREIAEQKVRYRKIEHQMNVVLVPKRDKWIAAFLERLQTRGYHVHFNMMRKIPASEIPSRPKRRFRVVF